MSLREYLFYEEPGIQLFCGDCRAVLPLLASADIVIADPPYTFGLASVEGKTGWADLMNGAYWYVAWLREIKRLTAAKRAGAAWVFNSWRSFPVLARAAYDAEWAIESLMVWDKEWIGPGGPRGLRPSYELAALFVQPGFAIPNRGLSDIWRAPYSSHRAHGHAAEKPIDLVARMIRESGQGQDVLDPFCGSGTTLDAAKREGRRAIGIEIEPKYCEIAVKRLRQEVLALSTEETT